MTKYRVSLFGSPGCAAWDEFSCSADAIFLDVEASSYPDLWFKVGQFAIEHSDKMIWKVQIRNIESE